MTNEKLKNIKKVELHLHLDGSITKEYVKNKYKLSNEEISNKMDLRRDNVCTTVSY